VYFTYVGTSFHAKPVRWFHAMAVRFRVVLAHINGTDLTFRPL
jgi:hypothetical protein